MVGRISLLARQALAVLLALALVFGGVARLAPAWAADRASIVIAGVSISICQTDDGAGDRGQPQHHDCGLCCLRAADASPLPPAFAQPMRLPRLLAAAPSPQAPAPAEPAFAAYRPRGPPASA